MSGEVRLGPKSWAVIHTWDQAEMEGVREGRGVVPASPLSHPLRGLLSEGPTGDSCQKVWHPGNLPPSPASCASFNPVLGELSEAAAAGQGENRQKCIRTTVLWSRGGRTGYRRAGRGSHSNFPNNPAGGAVGQPEGSSSECASQRFVNSPSRRSSKGCRYELIT